MSHGLRNILITGASGGIGSALAKAYAATGTRLILTGRNRDKLTVCARECEQQGAEVIIEVLDITDFSAVSEWVVTIQNKYPLDLVIANAGVNSTIGAQGEAETFLGIKKVFDVNTYGVIATIAPLIDAMKKNRQGQIAIVSSLAAYRGLPQSPAYSASKAAIKVYGEALRAWLKPYNIKVSVICPGFVTSAMCDSLSGPKPLLWQADKAAFVIKRKLSRNKGHIAFPWILHCVTWLTSVLPARLIDPLLRLPKVFVKNNPKFVS